MTPRLALVSDIHGNTWALRAVLDDLRTRAVDLIVDLGDIASGGLDPHGTVAVLRGLDRPAVHVRGNHERQVVQLDRDAMGRSDQLARDTLTSDDLAWLATLSPLHSPFAGVLAFHGCPDDDLQYLLHTVTPDGVVDATADDVVHRLSRHRGGAELFVCGHTHLQGDRRLPDGALVVNPGSVGWPAYDDDRPYPHVMQAGTPHARYSLVARDASGWTVEHVALDYDHEAAAAGAEANDRRDVAYALRHGRVRPA